MTAGSAPSWLGAYRTQPRPWPWMQQAAAVPTVQLRTLRSVHPGPSGQQSGPFTMRVEGSGGRPGPVFWSPYPPPGLMREVARPSAGHRATLPAFRLLAFSLWPWLPPLEPVWTGCPPTSAPGTPTSRRLILESVCESPESRFHQDLRLLGVSSCSSDRQRVTNLPQPRGREGLREAPAQGLDPPECAVCRGS